MPSASQGTPETTRDQARGLKQILPHSQVPFYPPLPQGGLSVSIHIQTPEARNPDGLRMAVRLGDSEGGRGHGVRSMLNWGRSCHWEVGAGRDQVPEVLFNPSLMHTPLCARVDIF